MSLSSAASTNYPPLVQLIRLLGDEPWPCLVHTSAPPEEMRVFTLVVPKNFCLCLCVCVCAQCYGRSSVICHPLMKDSFLCSHNAHGPNEKKKLIKPGLEGALLGRQIQFAYSNTGCFLPLFHSMKCPGARTTQTHIYTHTWLMTERWSSSLGFLWWPPLYISTPRF